MDVGTDPCGWLDSATHIEQRRRATLAVATAARDAAECATLLDMLGLTPLDGLVSHGGTDAPTVPAPRETVPPELPRPARLPVAAAGRRNSYVLPEFDRCCGWSESFDTCPG